VAQKQLIACVDDDRAVCETMMGLLRAFDFDAEVFSSAEEFFQSGRLDETSCLITDVQLGGMSGLQLQSRLADLGYRIPVIVITAFPDDRVSTQAMNAGAINVLSKPMTKDALLGAIRSALDRCTGTKGWHLERTPGQGSMRSGDGHHEASADRSANS
jgi:FixJ family two-component response regulator